ncbi:PREDICTED: RNA-directed DNA polymerase from mobile element jockey-like, partial [Cyphomyrmex costatus]|uniref:RNA-directed DNA polymerase from mobile element jockey-like n=1 Tax=Cyphomyrmex costatus TaxID=456900 RepID=UPI0008522F33
MTKDCPIKEKVKEVKCANCGGNHPASYKGCSVRKQLQQKLYPKLREKITTQNIQNNMTNKSLIKPNLSFAHATSNQQQQQPQEINCLQTLPEIQSKTNTTEKTHFTDKNYFKIPNYCFYDTKHPDGKAHGGTAIIIKSNFKHYENEKNIEDFLQATSITLEDTHGPLTLAAIYCPPKHSIKTENFTAYFDKCGHRFIAAGDYNAKHPWWGSRSTTPTSRGRQLFAAMQSRNLFPISTGEPTYWPSDLNKTPDLLDFAVVKGICPERLIAESCLDLNSDHSPIIISFNAHILIQPKMLHLTNKKTDWAKYKELLNHNLSCNISLKTIEELEKAIDEFNLQILNAAKVATPTTHDQKKLPSISKRLLDKIREKRQLRKNWQNTRCKFIKTKLNKIIKELKDLIIEDKNLSTQKYLESLTPNHASDYSLWKATKKFKRPQQHIPPIRKPDGKWARNEFEKSKLFAEYLSDVFKPLPREISIQEEQELTGSKVYHNEDNEPIEN